jgi:Ca-activated chloride channel family protein
MKNSTTNNGIQLEVKSDKGVVSNEKKTTRILEFSITPPQKEQSNHRSPLNISLVLDRSGSMSGEKLQYVKEAALHVLDLLDEQDVASVVVYDDRVETLVTAGKITEGYRRQAKNLVQTIRSGNSTFLSGGWLKGCEQVASIADGQTINRTLLLTDGQANVGIQDPEELATHARELFRRGVSTSCFGVGTGYDEHLLEGMANNGGGNFHFLETTNAIPVVFEREFNELVDISLREVEVVVKLSKGVRAHVSAGWPHEFRENRLILSLGSLYAGRTQRIYIKLTIDPVTSADELVFPCTLRGKDKNDYVVDLNAEIKFAFKTNDEEEKAEQDNELLERFTEVDMADKANEALKLERAGDRAGANVLYQTSIDEHQAHMSAPMRSKFDFMATEFSRGMSEDARKRHHQEEYENKRGRGHYRHYYLRVVNGHLITEIEGQSILVDSGIPISLGKTPEFYFLNEIHNLSTDYMGVSLVSIEKLVGTKIDVLLGMDILKKLYVTVELKRNRIEFSSQKAPQSSERIPMTNFMGVPMIKAYFNNAPVDMFLDTGAKLSYIKKEIVSNLKPVGTEKDFYPGMGEFETPIYEIPFMLGLEQITLRFGVLPALLESTLLVTGKSGIIGAELFDKFTTYLAFPANEMFIGN